MALFKYANIAACRSYLSAATRFSERTKAVSMISLAQVLGFIIGPAVQAVVVPLGTKGVWVIRDLLELNMYTAAGWINVVFSIINFILFLPWFFKEHRIAAKEAMVKQGKSDEKETWKGAKLDYVAIWTLLLGFFIIVFNFMLLETLGTPMTMDQFAWSNQEALYYMGFLMSFGAIVACLTFFAINPLCNRFPEWKIMIWGGVFFMLLGQLADIPWGSTTPKIYQDDFKFNSSNISICKFQEFTVNSNFGKPNVSVNYYNLTLTFANSTETNNVVDIGVFDNTPCINQTELIGCPASQEWCSHTPAIKLYQFLIGYIFTSIGYPVGVTLVQTLYSKILGPRPQGVWMGFMVGSGCLSRVMGPVFVTYIYSRYGTIVTFSMTSFMMTSCMIWLLIVRKRLLPIEDVFAQKQPDVEFTESNTHTHDLKVAIK